MCTMTWFVSENGYELFFNRDEGISRSRATLPAQHTFDGVKCLSPTDTDAGGTWIAVNEYGFTVCLLNHYQFQQIETYKDWISRGEIVKKFASSSNLFASENSFRSMKLNDYRAFRMFIIAPDGSNRLLVWDGHKARVEVNVTKPKSSSSVDALQVKKLRKDLFESMSLGQSKNVTDYISYHASHLPSPSKESVCMHREDANTVSFSHVSVKTDTASFSYADGAPCEATLGEPINLALRSLPQAGQKRVLSVK